MNLYFRVRSCNANILRTDLRTYRKSCNMNHSFVYVFQYIFSTVFQSLSINWIWVWQKYTDLDPQLTSLDFNGISNWTSSLFLRSIMILMAGEAKFLDISWIYVLTCDRSVQTLANLSFHFSNSYHTARKNFTELYFLLDMHQILDLTRTNCL